MGTIPSYGPPVLPLADGDYVAVWQDGAQKGARVTDLTQHTVDELTSVADGAAAAAAIVATQKAALATLEANRASLILASQLADANGIYPDLAAGAAAVAEGDFFFVDDGDYFYSARKVGGVGVTQAIFDTIPRNSVDVRDAAFGAKADQWSFTDGVIAVGSLSTITFTNTEWKSSAVEVGNPICIQGAGAAGGPLATTIAAFTAPGTITLAAPAAAAMAAASGDLGTNDRAAIQAAIDFAWSLGISEVLFGGATNRYMVAGVPATYGTFVLPDGTTEPFPRGLIKMRSGVSYKGHGALIAVAGGYTLAPGIFYNEYWTDSTPTYIENIVFEGLRFDGNVAGQVIQVYPANYAGQIWQHGSAITIVIAKNVWIRNCQFTNFRGDALRGYGNDDGTIGCKFIRFTDNELSNIFTQGVGVVAEYLWIQRNWFHGDGFWVGAIDVEVFQATDVFRNVWITDNEFDFSDGLSPPERTPQYASNSADAVAKQVHMRRAVTISVTVSDGSIPASTGNAAKITFARNKVRQGIVTCAGFRDVEIYGNQFTNEYEDLTGHNLIAPHCISVVGYSMTNLRNLLVYGNIIDSDLAGWGIYTFAVEQVKIFSNFITRTRQAGIAANAAGASVYQNEIVNVGRAITGADVSFPDQYSAGVFVVGNPQGLVDVTSNTIRDERTTPLMTVGVSTAVPGGCLVQDNRTSGMTVGPTNNSATTTYFGNCVIPADGLAASWSSNVPILAPSVTTTGAIKAGAAVTGTAYNVQTNGAPAAITFLNGTKILFQLSVDPTNADGVTMTYNRFTLDGSAVADQPLIVKNDGSVRLANGGMGFSKTMPVYADNASAINGGVPVGFAYRTATGQLMVAY